MKTITYTYDPLNRLTDASYNSGELFQYVYDEVGNRQSETTNAGTTNYTYDISNRMTSAGGVTYTWDANGNLLSDGVSTYTYNAANRMTGVSQGGVSYSFAYNGMGDRLQQTVDTVTTSYTLDLNAGFTQVLADGTNTYLYGQGRIAEQASTTWTYFHPDALGSVRQLSDSSGTLTLGQSYEPYGDVLNTAGTGSTSYGYTGEWTDGTGLVNLRARYMNTGIGRFMTRDTWAGDYNRPLSLNKWNYVEGNPVNFTDPSGLKPIVSITSGGSVTVDYSFEYIGVDLACGPASTFYSSSSSKKGCMRLSRIIEALIEELAQREFDIITNPLNLPLKGPMSVDSHQATFKNRQRVLHNRINEWIRIGCGPPPSSAGEYAAMPVPVPEKNPGMNYDPVLFEPISLPWWVYVGLFLWNLKGCLAGPWGCVLDLATGPG